MIKNILVCLEGSRSSDAATRAAIQIAQERRATLVGMAIVDEPDIRAAMPMGIGGSSFRHDRDEALLFHAHAHAKDWLATFERRCRDAGVPARTIEAVGRPAKSILDEMERHDFTVMGRDANFRSETADDDSATRAKILRNTTHPVLLIPEADPGDQASLGKTVLIAYDGSAPAEHALTSFAQSGLAEAREVHVAAVGDDGEKAWDLAQSAALKLGTFGIKTVTHNLVSALPTSDALVELAADLGAGLLVMGAFSHSRLAELIRGSRTRNIVEHSKAAICLQH